MKYTASFLFFVLLAALTAAELEVVIRPEQPSAGMSAELCITSDSGMPSLRSVPKVDGIDWSSGVSQSMQTQSVNGKTTTAATVKIAFTAEKEGEYEIPPFPVEIDGKMRRTRAVRFTVTAAPEIPSSAGKDGAEQLFATLEIPGASKVSECYVGQEFPLAFQVYLRTDFPYDMQAREYPVYDTADGVVVRFHDYRKTNPRAPNFDGMDQTRGTVGGKRYLIYSFRSKFRPVSPGTLELSVKWPVVFVEGSGFFASSVGERVIRATLAPVTVKPIPPVPDGLPEYSGLLGNWKWSAELNASPCRVGDPLTLKIRVRGNGSAEPFHAPALDLPGFRVYPAETEIGNGAVSVSYTLIPVREGELAVRFAASTFDPESGEYRPYEFERKVNAEKALSMVNSPKTYVDASGKNPAVPEEADSAAQKHRDVLYPHKDISKTVSVPVWPNLATIAAALILSGFVFFFAAILVSSREASFRDNPGLARRSGARKRKRAILKLLKAASPEELPALSAQLSQYLNDALDLPPGASLSDAAAQFNEERTVPFADALKKLSNVSWMPDAVSAITPELKKNLISGLSKFVCFALVLGLSFSAYAEDSATVSEKALAAYDGGDYRTALNLYAGELRKTPGRMSPSLLYNLGNCYYQLGELSRASVCYERALRLAPRDSDILVNLNLVRRKMLQPEHYKLEHPKDLIVFLRDSLRLDEWLLAAAAALAVCFVALGLRSLRKPLWPWVFFSALSVLLLAVLAGSVQNFVLYSASQAVVVKRNSPVYSLPSETNGKVEQQLKEGTDVHVEETRLGWARIRTGDLEGWIQKKDILPLWSEDPADLIPEQIP